MKETAFPSLAMFDYENSLFAVPDDEGVEKDHGLPGMFSVHLVEKIWILVNFIKREDSFDIRPGHFYW